MSLTAPDRNPNTYLLVQKMKMRLNRLTSNMSQLLDKVDLLSLELSKTRKLVGPSFMEMNPKSQTPSCPQRPIMAIEFQHTVGQNLLDGVPAIYGCM